MSAWSSCGQPSASQMPCFHSIDRGTSGHARQAEPAGLHRLPDVDERVPDHEHVRAVRPAAPRPRRSGSPWTRRPGGRPARRPGGPGRAGSAARSVGQVVDALEVLDDDALDAQVVAPDLLDQFGVVAALDEDPAGPGDPGRRIRRPRREPDAVYARRAPRWIGRHQLTGSPSSRKPRPSGNTRTAAAVLELDADPVDVHDRAAEAGGTLFEDEPVRGLDDSELPRRGPAGETGEHVGAVAVVVAQFVVWHSSRLTDERAAGRLTGRDRSRWCQLFDTSGWSVVAGELSRCAPNAHRRSESPSLEGSWPRTASRYCRAPPPMSRPDWSGRRRR